MSERPNGDHMVLDLQMCNRLVGDILTERDTLKTEVTGLRAAQVLWEIHSVDDGEVTDRFVAPVGWAPGETVQRFELAYDVRFHRVEEIPRLATDEAVLAYIKRK
jgi:hypothetical protein